MYNNLAIKTSSGVRVRACVCVCVSCVCVHLVSFAVSGCGFWSLLYLQSEVNRILSQGRKPSDLKTYKIHFKLLQLYDAQDSTYTFGLNNYRDEYKEVKGFAFFRSTVGAHQNCLHTIVGFIWGRRTFPRTLSLISWLAKRQCFVPHVVANSGTTGIQACRKKSQNQSVLLNGLYNQNV